MGDWEFPEFSGPPKKPPPTGAKPQQAPKGGPMNRQDLLAQVSMLLAKKHPQPTPESQTQQRPVVPPRPPPMQEPQPTVQIPTRPPVQVTQPPSQTYEAPPYRGGPIPYSRQEGSQGGRSMQQAQRPGSRNHSRSDRTAAKIEKMILAVYKTSRDLNRGCTGERCRFSHSKKDHRRKTDKFGYVAEMCPTLNDCPLGDDCVFAHNSIELEFHPIRYKTIQCSDPRCSQDMHCPYLHPGDTISRIRYREPDCETALAILNSLLPDENPRPDIASTSRFLERMSLQIDDLTAKLYCRSCYSDIVKVLWVPCGHAVCSSCANQEVCVFDGNSQCLKLLLE